MCIHVTYSGNYYSSQMWWPTFLSFFFLPDIRRNTRGTCLAWSSVRTNAFIVRSCWNGRLHSLKVPSMYQLLALQSCSSCWSVANTRWRLPCFFISARRKSAGMCSWFNSNSWSVGSRGLLIWRSRLAALARCSGLLSAGQGPSPSSSRRT